MKRFALAAVAVMLSAAATAPIGPDAEALLVRTVDEFATRYGEAPNDMAKGLVRRDRMKAVCTAAVTAAHGQVANWTGTVEKLDSISDGRGILSVRVSPAILVGTINNSFSEQLSTNKTLIQPDTALYAAVVRLSVGQKVRFSGMFFPSHNDCFEENSLTTGGSLTEPDYLFRFSAVAPAE